MVFTLPTIWLAIFTSAQLVHGYAEFGTVTVPCNFEPIFDIPRPKFIPEDVYMRYEPYSSSITAVAPSLRLGVNGTHETFWSLHFVEQPTRATRTINRDLRRRGVFSGDPPIPTCRQCDRNGNPIINGNDNSTNTDNGVPHCSITNYDGVFRDGAPSTSSTPSYCFDPGYTGPLVPTPIPTEAGLPCCPVCYPPSNNGTSGTNGTNTSFTVTAGVFSPTTTPGTAGTVPKTTSGAPSTTSKSTPGNPGISTKSTPSNLATSSKSTSGDPTATSKSISGSTREKETVTVTATQPITITQITLSIETVTPTSDLGSSVLTTGFGTIIGCGTASGCGTVIGSGTVYLAPLGYPAVTSSGTVSGCAPTIVGCGTMIATSGVFTAPTDGSPATITACGEGTGSATLIGSGTVWPAGFNDMVSFVSSGTLTGSGRVKGCGTITGYGTFTIDGPLTTDRPPTTVNVYVSYCPGDLGGGSTGSGLRLAGNFTGDGSIDDDDDGISLDNPHADDSPDANRYALSSLSNSCINDTSTGTYLNSTTSLNTTIINPLCRICPQDSGICCPPFTDCGTDGHCPWTALEGCGYALYGFNIVDLKNSSDSLGMGGSGAGSAKLKAPGLLGSKPSDGSNSENGDVSGSGSDSDNDSDDTGTDGPETSSTQKERRFKGQAKLEARHDHERGLTHRLVFAHFHGH